MIVLPGNLTPQVSEASVQPFQRHLLLGVAEQGQCTHTLLVPSNLQCHSQLLERAGIHSRPDLLVDFCTFLACQIVSTSQMNSLFHFTFTGTRNSIHWLECKIQEAWTGL